MLRNQVILSKGLLLISVTNNIMSEDNEKKIIAVYEDKETVEKALEHLDHMRIDVEKRVLVGEVLEDEEYLEEVKKISAKKTMAIISIICISLGLIASGLVLFGVIPSPFRREASTIVTICLGFAAGGILGMFIGMIAAAIVGKGHFSFKDHFDIDYYLLVFKTKSQRKAQKMREVLNFSEEEIEMKLKEMNG